MFSSALYQTLNLTSQAELDAIIEGVTQTMNKHFIPAMIVSFILLLATANTVVFADMTLDNKHSSVSFVSVKKGTVAEAHHIKKLSGSLTDSGQLKVILDLASVDTKIEIRDQRIKAFLFETTKFTEATLTAQIKDIVNTDDGIKKLTMDAKLDLHGISQTIKVDVIVLKSGNTLLATSATPILINAADFKLDGGIGKLQELAKLPSIATAVPVNFTLVFLK